MLSFHLFFIPTLLLLPAVAILSSSFTISRTIPVSVYSSLDSVSILFSSSYGDYYSNYEGSGGDEPYNSDLQNFYQDEETGDDYSLGSNDLFVGLRGKESSAYPFVIHCLRVLIFLEQSNRIMMEGSGGDTGAYD